MLVFFTNPVPDDLQKLRGLFPVMSKQENAIEEIKTICTKTTALSKPLAAAYLAAAEMASAQYKINPLSKLSAFNSGKKMLEGAVNSDSINVEIRYIRYTIQNNAPSFLGY